MADRDFKGIWIPREIWEDGRLSGIDKLVLTEIDSLDKGEGCWPGNEYLAKFLQVATVTVSRSISLLLELHLLEHAGFDGRKRYIRSALSKRQGSLINLKEQPRQNDKVLELETSTNDNASVAGGLAPSRKPVNGAIDFSFESFLFKGISDEQVEAWSLAYPALDVDTELAKAASWLKVNPAKRKKNYGRFLVNWLSRAQERGGDRVVRKH